MVNIAIVGIGNMGSAHAVNIFENKVDGMRLVAACDISEIKRKWAMEKFDDTVSVFSDYKEMLEKNDNIDAVLVATPHYFHTEIAEYCFDKGLHVLIEKPAGVYTKAVKSMNKKAKEAGKKFAIMFNQRTNPLYNELRRVVKTGELGEVRRIVWIITNWYRTQAYYDSGTWRASWKGEGGGVLLNQCPHNLDIWQWIFGVPDKVTAKCNEGKYHNIEVEDEVTAFYEYSNGASGVFITTTADCPGTNRLEVTGDYGKIILEDGKMFFHKLAQREREFCFESKEGFSTPPIEIIEIKSDMTETAHVGILQNFANAILNNEELIAPGYEGINSLEMSNAMYLSSWENRTVELPVDDELFFSKLTEKINTSSYTEKVEKELSKSHGTMNVRWTVR